MQYYMPRQSKPSGSPPSRRYADQYDSRNTAANYQKFPSRRSYGLREFDSSECPSPSKAPIWRLPSPQPPTWSLPNPQPPAWDPMDQEPHTSSHAQNYRSSFNKESNLSMPNSPRQSYDSHGDYQFEYKNSPLPQPNEDRMYTSEQPLVDSRPRYFCEICKIVCIGNKGYRYHVKGQKHRKNEHLLKKQNVSSLNGSKRNPSAFIRNPIECPLCHVVCNGLAGFKDHILGKSHLRTERIYIQIGVDVPDCQAIINNRSINPRYLKSKRRTGNFNKGTSDSDSKIIVTIKSDGSFIHHCRLCDCTFRDSIAMHLLMRKNIHKKLQRRALANASKVSFPQKSCGELQPSTNSWFPRLPQGKPRCMNQFSSSSCRSFLRVGRNHLVFNEGYLLTKVRRIIPGWVENAFMIRAVEACESALREMIDTSSWVKESLGAVTSRDDTNIPSERRFEGIFRVGSLINGMFLKGEMNAELVVATAKWPTSDDTRKLGRKLEDSVNSCEEYGVTVAVKPEDGTILVKVSSENTSENMVEDAEVQRNFTAVIRIQLASVCVLRNADDDSDDADQLEMDDHIPLNSIPRNLCIKALLEVRRTLWLQDLLCKHIDAEMLVNIALVFKEIMHERVPAQWGIIPDFTLLVLLERLACPEYPLCQNAVGITGRQIQPYLLFRRMIEALSAGFLMPGAEFFSLEDPSVTGGKVCFPDLMKLPSHLPLLTLTPEDCEYTTCTAQECLRLIVSRHIYKVLGVEPAPYTNSKNQLKAAAVAPKPSLDTPLPDA